MKERKTQNWSRNWSVRSIPGRRNRSNYLQEFDRLHTRSFFISDLHMRRGFRLLDARRQGLRGAVFKGGLKRRPTIPRLCQRKRWDYKLYRHGIISSTLKTKGIFQSSSQRIYLTRGRKKTTSLKIFPDTGTKVQTYYLY